MLLGRDQQKNEIQFLLGRPSAQFIGLYGRRRVGKTYFMKQYFQNEFAFYCTGLQKGNKKLQIANFVSSLQNYFPNVEITQLPQNWLEAFMLLENALKEMPITDKKHLIFIDELPWMAGTGYDLVTGLEAFWNQWASTQPNIALIVCGSATSWMMKNIFCNSDGLYNRLTGKIYFEPFALKEVEAYFNFKNCNYTKKDCLDAYFCFGGIPYYLDLFNPQLSVVQNIDRLCFGKNAILKAEYQLLFKSLFKKYSKYIEIIEALATKKKGLTREELKTKISTKDGGGLTEMLSNLELCDFLKTYTPFDKKTKETLYQLIDPFCLFYKSIESKVNFENYWNQNFNAPTYNSWRGYAFEQTCLLHIKQLKAALGISGISSTEHAWRNKNAQIDILIDRADNILQIVECKYSQAEFEITKLIDENLRNKANELQVSFGKKKAIRIALITTYGLKQNNYSNAINNVILMPELFR